MTLIVLTLDTQMISLMLDVNTFHLLFNISHVHSVWRSSVYIRHTVNPQERKELGLCLVFFQRSHVVQLLKCQCLNHIYCG